MADRFYDIDGMSLPSVTTILSVLNKPALMPWAAKMTAEAFAEQIIQKGVHNVKDGIISITWDVLEDAKKESKKAYRAKSKEAMDIGTKVHEAIENWIESGGKMTPDEIQDEQIRKGLEAFLAWGAVHEVEIVNHEQQVTDYKTYAGRYDLLANVDERLTLVDFKTSTGIWDEYWYQLGAYAACVEENVHTVAVLRIDKETGEIEYKEESNWLPYANAFLTLAEFYQQKLKLEGKNGNHNR